MRILGFWHIFLTGHYYSIVTDQLRILLTSGLYDACEEINIGCLGMPEEKVLLERLIVNQYPKLKIKYYSEDRLEYEFSTLRLIEQDKTEYVGFYFHTKGVTNPSWTIINHWRAWLNEAILNSWQAHKEHVENGYDVSSVNYCHPPKHPYHFSGNFWWFRRSYINRLPPIDRLDQSNRYNAEMWICLGRGRYFAGEFVEPGTDVFTMKYK
jgi:hypothetical protein